MVKLESLVNAFEAHFGIQIQGSYSKLEILEALRFVDEKDAQLSYLLPNYFYIADFSKFGKTALYGNVLFIGCGEERPAADGIYIKEGLELSEVYNFLSGLFQENLRVNKDKDKLFRTLLLGKGLEELLASAYSLLKNQIVICDSSFGVIASYPPVTDHDALEPREDRLAVRQKYISHMRREHIIDIIYHSVYPFVTDIGDIEGRYDYPRIFESIRIKQAVVGYLFIPCTSLEINDNVLELVHALSQMISIQLQKDDDYSNPEGIKFDLFLKNLIFNKLTEEEAAKNHLNMLGLKPQGYFYVVVSGFSEGYQKLLATNYYCQQLATIFPNSLSGTAGESFVTLISSPKPEYASPHIMEKLESFLRMNHMVASVSYLFEAVLDTHLYYKQATIQTEKLKVSYREYPIAFYQDYYLEHMVRLMRKHELIAASIHPSVKLMIKYDRENHTQYLDTLKMFFKSNRSAPATAKALFLHKSTLFYRLDKMKSLFHIELENPDALFAYEYSLRVLELLKSA